MYGSEGGDGAEGVADRFVEAAGSDIAEEERG